MIPFDENESDSGFAAECQGGVDPDRRRDAWIAWKEGGRLRFTTRERLISAVALGAAILFQLHVAILAFWQGPTFLSLFEGLGGELPLVTRTFIATYRFWGLSPLLFTLLSLDVLRRDDPPLKYFAGSLIAATAVAFLLQAWFHQAVLAPMLDILYKIG